MKSAYGRPYAVSAFPAFQHFVLWLTAILAVLLLPALLLPAGVTRLMARLWGCITVVTLRVAGGHHRIGGDIALDRQVIYAAKHQSAWKPPYWPICFIAR